MRRVTTDNAAAPASIAKVGLIDTTSAAPAAPTTPAVRESASGGRAAAVGRERRRAARLDLPGAQRRKLRRPARLPRRRRRDRPSRHAVQLRLRRPDAGLPAAVHLSAVRGGRLLPAAPCCRSAWSPSCGRSRRSPRCTARFGSASACWACAVRRSPPRDVVDGGRHLDRAAAQHLRLRAGQCAADAGGAVGGLHARGGGCRGCWSAWRPGSS